MFLAIQKNYNKKTKKLQKLSNEVQKKKTNRKKKKYTFMPKA